MRPHARLLTALLALVIAAQAALMWDAAGRALFTSDSHDPHAAGPSISELFRDTGLEDDTGPMPERPQGFRMGLLPSAPDHRAASVLTIAGPAAIIALYALTSRAPRPRSGAQPR